MELICNTEAGQRISSQLEVVNLILLDVRTDIVVPLEETNDTYINVNPSGLYVRS